MAYRVGSGRSGRYRSAWSTAGTRSTGRCGTSDMRWQRPKVPHNCGNCSNPEMEIPRRRDRYTACVAGEQGFPDIRHPGNGNEDTYRITVLVSRNSSKISVRKQDETDPRDEEAEYIHNWSIRRPGCPEPAYQHGGM